MLKITKVFVLFIVSVLLVLVNIFVPIYASTLPSVNATNANNITVYSARLNGQITDYGGDLLTCEVRFGYGLVSQTAVNFNSYTTITDYDVVFTGFDVYFVATGLLENSVYYYRVQVKNSFIIGGCYNRIVSNDDINLQSEYNTIGGGCGNSICGTKSILPTSLGYNCIGSGDGNCIYACSCNCTYAWFNTISNGSGNSIVTRDSGSNVYGSYQIGNDIFGGSNNCLLQVVCSTTDSGMYAVMESAQIFGGTLNKICTIIASTNTVGEAYSCNNTILGGHNNSIGLIDSPTIGSGVRMFNNAILTGYQNTITNNCYNNYGLYNVVVGGRQNIIGCSSFSSVTGGCRNIIISLSTHSSISGGISNTISSSIASAILGGSANDITSVNCSMAFGRSNVVAHNFAGVIGCGITSVLACALHTNRMVVTNMPTSSAGLPSGTLYSDAGTIKIVP